MPENTFEIPDNLYESFNTNRANRDSYEESDEYIKEIQEEIFQEEYAPIAKQETSKIAKDDDTGVFGSILNFGKNIAIGGAKGIEETGQTLRILDDNAWKLPTPRTTAESLAQGFGQFLPLFIPTNMALGAGLKFANLLTRSKKLTKAGQIVSSMTAGAVSDSMSFDPKDPNVANFLLTTGAISRDSTAGATLKTYLAQDDSDPELKARAKAAASGVIAGVILDQLIRGAGGLIKKAKKTKKGTQGELFDEIDGVPIEEIRSSAKDYVNDEFIPGAERVVKEHPDQLDLFNDTLPDEKAALKDQADKATNDYRRPWERLTATAKDTAIEIIKKWGRGEKVTNIDLETIESMNFLKLNDEIDVKQLLQYLSQQMDIKALVKGRKIPTEEFDTMSGLADVLGVDEGQAARIFEEQAQNVRGAIKYVGVAKALASATMKKAEDAFEMFASSGNQKAYEEGLKHTKLSYDMLAAGGQLSKASSDLLRSHAKLVDGIDNLEALKTLARHSIVYNDPKLRLKQAGWFTVKRNLDEAEYIVQFQGLPSRKIKINKKGLSTEELRAKAISKAKEVELKDIGEANLKQIKGRLNAMNKSFGARTRDAMLEIYINGLLSSFKTFEVNILGNMSAIFTSIIDRAYAGAKTGGEVSFKEATELGWGYINSLPDMWKLMQQARKLEATTDIKQDFIRPDNLAISKEAWRTGGNLGKAIDMFGTVVNIPGRLLLSADEVFKTFNYRAETRALAYRKAYNEVGGNSTIAEKIKIKSRQDEIMGDLNAHDDITEAAKGFSAKNTYTNKLASYVEKDPLTGKDRVVQGLGLRLKGILEADPTGMARVFIPFFQTPANLLNFAWERTPLIRRWNRTLQAELSPEAPKAVRELAEAKVATSRIMWGSFFGLAMTGNFTGGPPRDPNLRKTLEADMGGSHWYSFNLGGGWRKYDRYDPLGVMMAGAAHMTVMAKASMNLAGQYKNGDPSDEIHEKFKEVLEAGVIGTARLITDRHYLQGFTELINIFAGDQTGFSKLRPFSEKVASYANPFHSFYSSFRRNATAGIQPEKLQRLQRTDLESLDDVAKEIGLIFEEGMRKVTPGYGDRRAVKNLVGEPVLFPGSNHEIDSLPFQIIANLANSMFNPTPPLIRSKSPLIRKLAELESTLGQPSGVNKISGVLLTDEEKGYFTDEWTTANKKLDKFVTTKTFTKLPQGTQRLLLETLIRANKKKANKMTIVEFPRLAQGIFENKKHDMYSKTQQNVPTGFNMFNLQQPQGQQ